MKSNILICFLLCANVVIVNTYAQNISTPMYEILDSDEKNAFVPVFYYDFTNGELHRNFRSLISGITKHGDSVVAKHTRSGLEVENYPITAYSHWWLPNNVIQNRNAVVRSPPVYKRIYRIGFEAKADGRPISFYLFNSPNYRIDIDTYVKDNELSIVMKSSEKSRILLNVDKISFDRDQPHTIMLKFYSGGSWVIYVDGNVVGEITDDADAIQFTSGVSNRIFIEGKVKIYHIECVESMSREAFNDYGKGLSKNQIRAISEVIGEQLKIHDFKDLNKTLKDYGLSKRSNFWLKESIIHTDYEKRMVHIEGNIQIPLTNFPAVQYTVYYDEDNGIRKISISIPGIDHYILVGKSLEKSFPNDKLEMDKLYIQFTKDRE